ncbi:hypothetical protein [Mesorhizobium sp. CN2-181]
MPASSRENFVIANPTTGKLPEIGLISLHFEYPFNQYHRNAA